MKFLDSDAPRNLPASDQQDAQEAGTARTALLLHGPSLSGRYYSREDRMHKTRPQCYEIPTVYVALALKHAVERKKAVVMPSTRIHGGEASERKRPWQLLAGRHARSARPAA